MSDEGALRPRFPLRELFGGLLIALAASSCGAPSLATALALAGTILLAAAIRAWTMRGRDRMGTLRRAALPLTLALGAALLAVWGHSPEHAAPRFQVSWWLLVGVPFAIWVAQDAEGVLPRVPALAACFYFALMLGLLGAEPWDQRVGRMLVAALAVVGVAAAALDATRRMLPRGAPAPSSSSWRRAIATWIVVALLALLCGVGLDLALGPLPRSWLEPPPPPRNDALGARLPAPTAGDPTRTLALVRWLGDGAAPPARLYLRERVLDELIEGDDLLYLGARIGAASWRRDDEDGVLDHRVVAPEAASGAAATDEVAFQVTLLGAAPRVLLRVDAPRWIDGESFTIGPDLAFERPNAQSEAFSYRVGAALPDALLAASGSWSAAPDLEGRRLPDKFDGRATFEALLAKLAVPAGDARSQVHALVENLRSTGRIDASQPFRSWTDFLALRAGSPLHFAQSAALLARLARFPARVVAGFATDRFVAAERSFEVRANDAHYWIEVAFDERGWVGFDPCPLLAGASDSEVAEAALEQQDQVDRKSLRNTFVQQRPLIVGLALLLLVAAIFAFPTLRTRVEQMLRSRGPAGVAPPARRAWRFWQELIERCRRHGLAPHPSWTASEFASALAAALPSQRDGLSDLLRLYHEGRFGNATLAEADEARVREVLDAELPAALTIWQRERKAATPDAPDRNRR